MPHKIPEYDYSKMVKNPGAVKSVFTKMADNELDGEVMHRVRKDGFFCLSFGCRQCPYKYDEVICKHGGRHSEGICNDRIRDVINRHYMMKSKTGYMQKLQEQVVLSEDLVLRLKNRLSSIEKSTGSLSKDEKELIEVFGKIVDANGLRLAKLEEMRLKNKEIEVGFKGLCPSDIQDLMRGKVIEVTPNDGEHSQEEEVKDEKD